MDELGRERENTYDECVCVEYAESYDEYEYADESTYEESDEYEYDGE